MNMLQKFAILGLLLLLAGGGVFAWLHRQTQNERLEAQSLVLPDAPGSQEYIEKYGRWYQLSPERQNQLLLELDAERKSRTPAQLYREQQARLQADLDKLAVGQMNPGDIADFLYGPDWKSRVEEYRQHQDEMATVRTVGVVCLSGGATVCGGSVILWLLCGLIRKIRAWRRRSESEPETEPKLEELTDLDLPETEPSQAPEEPMPEDQPKQRRKLAAPSELSGESCAGELLPERSGGMKDLFHVIAAGTGPAEKAWPAPADSGVALLLTDEPSSAPGWSPQAQWSVRGEQEARPLNPFEEQPLMRRSTVQQSGPEGVATTENIFKEQAENLQKQIAEFKQAAQNAQQATKERSEPISSTLKELTQQVLAIREYAATQQDRVEKLQDGYDWGIIRTFCLRVIRCIDNLENRLADLPSGDGAARYLEEVRDELLFALESSSLEQYRPELNSEFQGQEKLAEALKDKEPAKKPEQAGKIAKIVRPGYRYLMDDENYRIVRTAQVKIYG
jgi:molecular chaperone GrpE (heat shock protein)